MSYVNFNRLSRAHVRYKQTTDKRQRDDRQTNQFPWDDLRNFFTQMSQMANVPKGVKILPKILIA